MGLEIFWLNGQSFDQACRIGKEMRRAIKLRTEPFMRIEHEGVRALNPGP